MKVSDVAVNGTAAGFEQSGQELVITPATQIPAGAEFTVDVAYGGVPKAIKDPDGATEGWIATGDGAAAPGEPQGAPTWFPCNDHPSDKALFTIDLTVPKKLQAISNGELAGRSRSGDKRTWSWQETQPMATYLATVAIGKFDITERSRGGASALRDRSRGEAQHEEPRRQVAATVPHAEADRLPRGPLRPLPVLRERRHRRPDQGLPLRARDTGPAPLHEPSQTGLVIHELAHQWFGDSLSVNWPNIWLNEGFATYAEWLYSEDHGGDTAKEIFDSQYGTPAEEKSGSRPPAIRVSSTSSPPRSTSGER